VYYGTEKEMFNINTVALIGRLTKRPELKKTTSNTSVTSFTLAVSSYVNGEEKADFIECVAWSQIAETVAKYCDKGHRIGISGRISTRTYETNKGETRYVTEVVVERLDLLESKKVENTATDEFSDATKKDFGKDAIHGQTRITDDETMPF